MKNNFYFLFLLLFSCGPKPCDCVEQFKYFEQDGGLQKLDPELSDECVKKYKDDDAMIYPYDYESAKKNVLNKCK